MHNAQLFPPLTNFMWYVCLPSLGQGTSDKGRVDQVWSINHRPPTANHHLLDKGGSENRGRLASNRHPTLRPP